MACGTLNDVEDLDEALGRYFGEVDDEFVTTVGQAVLLSGLLEARELDLLWR